MTRPATDRAWWPPAHPWGERRDEALALRSSRYSWRLPILLALVLLLLGTTLVRGVGRGDPLAIGVPLVLGGAVLVVLAKALDARIERRSDTGAVQGSPVLQELRGLHGLESVDLAGGVSWPVDLPTLNEPTSGAPVQVVAALRRGNDLVVALVAGSDGAGPRDVLILRRLPLEIGTFAVRPRRRPDTRVGAGLGDLYEVEPSGAAIPAPLAAWLVADRPHLRVDAAGDWLALHPPADARAVDGDARVATADDLIATADRLAGLLGP